MTVDEEGKAHNEYFRGFVGTLCVIGSLAGFGALYLVEIPARNENALLLALGYIFGWGSAVVQSEFGASTTGRRVAEHAIRRLEHQPVDVVVDNTTLQPIPTKPVKG